VPGEGSESEPFEQAGEVIHRDRVFGRAHRKTPGNGVECRCRPGRGDESSGRVGWECVSGRRVFG
jgi:hypothetical protein